MKPLFKLAAVLLALAVVPAFAETHYIETPGPNPNYVAPGKVQAQQTNFCAAESAAFSAASQARDAGQSPQDAYKAILGLSHENANILALLPEKTMKLVVNFVYFSDAAQSVDFSTHAGNDIVYSYCMRDWKPAHDWQPVK